MTTFEQHLDEALADAEKIQRQVVLLIEERDRWRALANAFEGAIREHREMVADVARSQDVTLWEVLP